MYLPKPNPLTFFKPFCSSSFTNFRVFAFAVMLLKFSEMERRYGGHKYPKIESCETLKAQGVLLDWDYTPPNAKIIYVSHEWVANKHADPRGVHVRVLLNVLRRLKQGKIDEIDINMRIKISRGINLSLLTTTREEWMKFLSSDT